MKNTLLFLLIAVSICSANEIGMILGRPTGLSYKNQFGASTAFDFQLGWNYDSGSRNNGYIDFHGSYLFAQRSDIRIEGYNLPFYFGPGGRIKIEDDNNLTVGLKVPFGLYYKFRNTPFSLSIELGPCLNFGSKTDLEIVGGLIFRYIFTSGGKKETPAETAADPAKRERR